MMGPDCGTAIVNGVPLGFANNVEKGSIGMVAASGTGLQQVSCLIDRWGGGISQAIGTGGRDLSTKVGGATMIAGIDALAADSNTEVIVLISKPPSQDVACKVLERAAKIINDDKIAAQMNDLPESLKDKVKGGGSLTALPIIETQAGDVSAYIPTNVISITDGQIFLESNLFLSGVRPAINVGISVSRVGGSAQIKSMKKISGTLKLDQAQYRELEAFAKFGSDLDAATKAVIEKGKRNVEILKQGQYSPLRVEEQAAIIYCGTNGLLMDVPVDKIKEFEVEFIAYLHQKHQSVLDDLAAGKLNDDITNTLESVVKELTPKYA